MALTSKELMLIQDNIKMAENSIKFMQGCAEIATDAQVKGLCQSMAKDHQTDMQTLIKHINSTTTMQ
jgi:rubrerythrin